MGRHGLGNVRIVRTEAAYFLTEMVRDSSVDCFHIYFPDPWPKKRHHKRRFINQTNLEQLLRCLKNNGLIKIVTDHAGYFEQIEQVIAAHSRQLAKTDFLPAGNSADGEWVGTNFERKYRKENRQIFCLAVIKTGLG